MKPPPDLASTTHRVRARDNPFRSERIEALRFRLLDTTWPELWQRLAALNYRAAILGPEGSGKTTLLEELTRRLRPAGFDSHWLQLRRGQRRFNRSAFQAFLDGAPDRSLLCIDGADLLDGFSWIRLRWRAARAPGLLITSHRPGLLPTLIECRTSPQLLADLLPELLEGESERMQPLMNDLYRKHQGNLHAVWRDGYDLHASGAIQKPQEPSTSCGGVS